MYMDTKMHFMDTYAYDRTVCICSTILTFIMRAIIMYVCTGEWGEGGLVSGAVSGVFTPLSAREVTCPLRISGELGAYLIGGWSLRRRLGQGFGSWAAACSNEHSGIGGMSEAFGGLGSMDMAMRERETSAAVSTNSAARDDAACNGSRIEPAAMSALSDGGFRGGHVHVYVGYISQHLYVSHIRVT